MYVTRFLRAKIPRYDYLAPQYGHAKNAPARTLEMILLGNYDEIHHPMTCFHSSMKKMSLLFLHMKILLSRLKQTS